jgi:hypothetical protein
MATQLAFDKTGKLQEPTAEQLAEGDKNSAVLSYIHGKSQGKPFWAYVAVKPSKYKEFHELNCAKKRYAIEDYGIIVASGEGEKPPESIIKEMRDRYGFKDNFGEELKQEAIRQNKIFFDKKEAERLKDIITMLQKQKPQ